jgi:hypothetical protein
MRQQKYSLPLFYSYFLSSSIYSFHSLSQEGRRKVRKKKGKLPHFHPDPIRIMHRMS